MLRKKDKINDSSKQTWALTTTKLIIAQNKCQYYEHANGPLLKKNYQCWEDIKIIDCWKQISMLTTIKLIIARNKHQ